MAKSTYWVGQYEEAVDGGPLRERGGLTLSQARRLRERWDDPSIGYACIMRQGADGELHQLRTFRSRLPAEVVASLTRSGFIPAI